MDLTEKALKTNGCNLSDLAVPSWNINKLKKDIALLEVEIEELRHQAFGCNFSKNKRLRMSGLDYDLLNSKISRLNSMNERLKSLELLKNG